MTNNRPFKLNWAFYNRNMKKNSEFSVYNILTKLYICGLDINIDEKYLLTYVSKKYFSVISAKIITDSRTKMSKGYGFLKFNDYHEYERALSELNGIYLKSKQIKVKYLIL